MQNIYVQDNLQNISIYKKMQHKILAIFGASNNYKKYKMIYKEDSKCLPSPLGSQIGQQWELALDILENMEEATLMQPVERPPLSPCLDFFTRVTSPNVVRSPTMDHKSQAISLRHHHWTRKPCRERFLGPASHFQWLVIGDNRCI